MPRPRSLKQALCLGLAAALALLLGACQPLEHVSPASEASSPQPVAPEPVIEAPVPVAVVAPAPARPAVPTGVLAGGVAIGGSVTESANVTANNTAQNAAIGTVTSSTNVTIGKSAGVDIAKTSAPNVGAIPVTGTGVPPPQPVPVEVVDSPAAAAAPDPARRSETSSADAEAQREAQDQLASLQETEAEIQVASDEPAPPIPQFPWPPPRASASAVIPAAFVKPGEVDTATLADVADEISAALDTGGYFERSYFGAPGGFAMVTRLERINPDGTPTGEAERWTVGALPLTSFSLAAYLRALFTAPSGHYRIIVFVVSSQPFAQSETEVAQGEALAWLSEGLNRLPDNMALAPFTPQHTVTALIYEFEQPGNQEAMLMLPANLMGRVHLQRAQLWDALRQ